jgi:uncharacterized protein (TIGR03083 family)
MLITENIEALRREGELLIQTAEEAGLDATVRTCHGWQVRDLVRHIGGIHRWATAYLTSDTLTDDFDGDESFFDAPGDEEIGQWFRSGHKALVDVLATSDPDLVCYTFHQEYRPSPSPLAFWARHQAHETTIHRVDAQTALGRAPEVDAAFAAEGIEQLLTEFFPGWHVNCTPEISMALVATDVDKAWTLRIGPDARHLSEVEEPADCVVRGPVADLYLLLWNRRDSNGLEVTGDRTVLDFWRSRARIRWE